MYQKAWNKNTLNSMRKQLLKNKNKTNDIKTAIKDLELIIKNLDEDYYGVYSPYQDLSFTTKTFNRYQHYLKYLLALEAVISKYSNSITNLKPYNSKLNLNFDDYLTITYDFYKQLDEELFNKFLPLFKECKMNLNFVKPQSEIYFGETFLINGLNKCYINIYDCGSLNTLLTFIHEYGHATSFMLNPTRENNINKRLFNEIETTFLELIAEDYLEHELSDYGFIDTRIDRFDVIHDFSDSALYMSEICKKFKQIKCHKRSKIKEIASIIDIDHHSLNNLLSVDYENAFSYTISFLIAANLYKLYLIDKEAALNELKRIITAPVNNNDYKDFKDKGMLTHDYPDLLLKQTIKRKQKID